MAISSQLKNKMHKTSAVVIRKASDTHPSLKVGWQKEGFFVSSAHLRYDKACGCSSCGRWWKPTRQVSGEELCPQCNPQEKAA